MTSKKLISVMIPCYLKQDEPEFLTKALESVLNSSSIDELLEIVVVDNNSEFLGVEEIVNQVGSGKVGYHRHPKTLSHSDNWNTCLELAKGDWVHLFHDDDELYPNFYSEILDVISKNPSVKMIHSDADLINENSKKIGDSHFRLTSNLFERLCYKNVVVAPSVVIKKEVFENLGGFKYFRLVSDWEMWLRISAKYPVFSVDKKIMKYRVSQNSDSSEIIRMGLVNSELVEFTPIIKKYSNLSLSPDKNLTLYCIPIFYSILKHFIVQVMFGRFLIALTDLNLLFKVLTYIPISRYLLIFTIKFGLEKIKRFC